ncbi:MAG TPA: heme-degrading domain-containing protein [Albitalea sp.]|uniref:heme-degrading domain-containing protein n=1 Tax=Piscinibacter sp. TaxID=1903157 RepID=UPI002ED5631D
MTEDFQTTLAQLLREEDELQFTAFDADTALALGLRLVEAARHAGQAVSIDIRVGELQLFQHAMRGTTPDNADWIRRKNNVVRRYAHSSFYMGTLYRSRGTSFEAQTGLDAREYAAHGGAFPLLVRGVGAIGTVTVSGLPQAEDHAMVVAALRAQLGGS